MVLLVKKANTRMDKWKENKLTEAAKWSRFRKTCFRYKSLLSSANKIQRNNCPKRRLHKSEDTPLSNYDYLPYGKLAKNENCEIRISAFSCQNHCHCFLYLQNFHISVSAKIDINYRISYEKNMIEGDKTKNPQLNRVSITSTDKYHIYNAWSNAFAYNFDALIFFVFLLFLSFFFFFFQCS